MFPHDLLYFTLFSVSSMVKQYGIKYQTSLHLRSRAEVAHLTISIPGSTLDPSEVRHGPTPKAPEKRVILRQDPSPRLSSAAGHGEGRPPWPVLDVVLRVQSSPQVTVGCAGQPVKGR